MTTTRWLVLGYAIAWPSIALGQESDSEIVTPPDAPVIAAARDGLFLPSTLAPTVGLAPVLVSTLGGYDSAHGAAVASLTTEAHLWGPIALRAGAEYVASRGGARPTVGGRVQLLRQARHGVDGSLSVFYRPEGFTEPEGEIETFVALGRRFGRLAVLGNAVYGQDPEGNERDGEVRFASVYAFNRWCLGVDSRTRFAIGQQVGVTAASEPRFDFMAGPVATVTVGPLALYTEAGPSVLKNAGATSAGVEAVGGIGTVF